MPSEMTFKEFIRFARRSTRKSGDKKFYVSDLNFFSTILDKGDIIDIRKEGNSRKMIQVLYKGVIFLYSTHQHIEEDEEGYFTFNEESIH